MSATALSKKADWLLAILVPVFYIWHYGPLGMDTTDFGYFYGYAWRILEGQAPYKDFFYIKPPFALYWHALWMSLTPEKYQILCGKIGFLLETLAASWLCALYLKKIFNFEKMPLSLPILATCGFVFSVHSFPTMPWHTADGALFCAIALFFSTRSRPCLAGAAIALAALCKQSFALMPLGLLAFLWFYNKRGIIFFLASFFGVLAAFYFWLQLNGAWENFKAMTTGQLALSEALDAGVFIYRRQNWLVPAIAALPCALLSLAKRRVPVFFQPAWCYLAILAIWIAGSAFIEKTWIGFGASWPTLFTLLGCACVLAPGFFLTPWLLNNNLLKHPGLAASASLAAALLAAWSCAISGGYKIPAFFSVPLLFSFFLIHLKFFGSPENLARGALLAGILMFGAAWQYPYVFPARPLAKSELVHDAGQVYEKASGVKVDQYTLEKLKELKELRAEFGPNYKTLPGFTLSYYLNGDKPVFPSDWLIDWEINGKVDQIWEELQKTQPVIFMERDQMDAERADSYDRAGYGVPQRVRKFWQIVKETPHFAVFKKPEP